MRLLMAWGDRPLKALAVVLLTLLVPAVALADSPAGQTSLNLIAPAAAELGQFITVKARLSDASGNPIADAKISFVNPDTFFLGVTSDAVIDLVNTGKDGVALLEYPVRSTGQLNLRAEFRGNDRYAASQANAKIKIEGETTQLYHQEAGVDIPGLDAPPFVGAGQHDAMGMAERAAPKTGLAALWPAMSFWPIGLALLVIWSLYAAAVAQTFRIAGAGGDAPLAAPAGQRRAAVRSDGGGRWLSGSGQSEYHISADGGDR